MITTVFHRLDVSDMQWYVSHLFEHLVIRGFLSLLDREGEHSELIGWINGETFEDALYIDAGFYDPRLAERFEQYLTAPPSFGEEEIDHALRVTSAEDKIRLKIQDKRAFAEQIATLSHRSWDEKVTGKAGPVQDVVTEIPAEEEFKDVALIVRADGLTATEQKVMLRLRTVVIDLILHVTSSYVLYPLGNSELALRDDAMAYMSVFTAENGVSIDDIKNNIENYVHSYEVDSAMPAIERHFEVFASEPLWQSMPIEYFRDTGIAVTNQEIAALATKETIKSLLAKISVVVREAHDDDYAHIK